MRARSIESGRHALTNHCCMLTTGSMACKTSSEKKIRRITFSQANILTYNHNTAGALMRWEEQSNVIKGQ